MDIDIMYFVSWYIHNRTTNEWNAHIVDKYSRKSAAEKEWVNQVSTYMDSETFDAGVVLLTDSLGNIHENKMLIFEPEPNVE